MGIITKEHYKRAINIIKTYNKQNNIKINIGDKYIYNKFQTWPHKPKLTQGKTYEVEDVKLDFQFKDVAIGIRNDVGELRWYSQNAIIDRWTSV